MCISTNPGEKKRLMWRDSYTDSGRVMYMHGHIIFLTFDLYHDKIVIMKYKLYWVFCSRQPTVLLLKYVCVHRLFPYYCE